MTTQNPPIFLQTESHPAEDVRRMFGAIMGDRAGFVGPTSMLVTQTGTASMAVIVSGGSAFIDGSSVYSGLYFVENRGDTTVAIDASDPTNPRDDLVIARISDSAYSGVLNEWSLEVVKGTPAASPVDPSLTGSYLVLARVRVGAGVTSVTNADITSLHGDSSKGSGFAASLGGEIVCTSTTRPTSPKVGQRIYETNTGGEYRWNGTLWRCVGGIFKHTTGAASISATASPGTTIASVTLEPGRWHVTSTGHFNFSIASNMVMTTEIDVGGTSIAQQQQSLIVGEEREQISLSCIVDVASSTACKVATWRNIAGGTVLTQSVTLSAHPI